MPSIIEVDTIKNKTGTQNTVLSTDGSGNNTLNAGVIKSNTGSNTGLTIASDGQVTISQNNPTVTLGSNTTFPKGVSSGVNYLLWRQTSSGTILQGTMGGTGQQIVPFDTIKNGTEDSAFTQNILSLSSNYWTMNTGYYIWDFWRPIYRNNHVFVQGIRTYGDSSGSGTTLGNVTNDNVNFGSPFTYSDATNLDGQVLFNTGVLKVTSTSQKYGFYINLETNNNAGGNLSYMTTASSTNAILRNIIRFIKIGEV